MRKIVAAILAVITLLAPISANADKVWLTKYEVMERVDFVGLDILPWDGDLQKWAQWECRRENISYAFFLAMVDSESTFIWQEGDSGKSKGYMQIRQCNWERYEDLNVDDPYDNVSIGIRMLGELFRKYDDVEMVIMAYKGGEAAMLKWVKEGFRLDVCDEIEAKQAFYQKEIDEILYWED